MRRIVSFGCALSVMVTAVVGTAGEAAAKPVTPRVTAISSKVGPLTARPLTLSGTNLQTVRAVRFGAAVATGLRHRGSRTLTLNAPASRRAGAVKVSLLSGRKWRNATSYTYLARPVVTRLAAASGPVSGGYLITVAGQAISYTPTVRLGAVALPIRARTPNSLQVLVPSGVLGKVHVTVTTPGGVSTKTAKSIFTYTTPSAANSVSYKAADATVTATGVQWVSRPDATGDDTAQDNYAPWIVSVVAGSSLPEIGAGYFLAPGSDVYPSGFAGTVRSLAAQQDGTTRVTVDPTALDDTLSNFSAHYAPAVPGGAASSQRHLASGAERFGFAKLRANVFDCTHGSDGEYATFTGEVGLRFDDVRPVFDISTGLNPSLNAYVAGSVTAYGKLAVDATMTCTLKKSWVNANKKIVPIGTTGATVSFAPAATIKITGNATVSVEQTTRFTYGLKIAGNGRPTYYQNVNQDAVKSSATATVTVNATLGAAVQIGWLDRVGIDIGAELYADGKLTYTASPRQVCANVALGFRLSVAGFLDLFFERWETDTAVKKFQFGRLNKCSAPDSAALANGDPQITSSTLSDATAGTEYDETLHTVDDRNGAWSIIGGSTPAGLSLSDNRIVGTTRSVGTFRPVVMFKDALGREALATLSLRVLPAAGLGGGDIQATLTWDSDADLDLHGYEPSGDEIYYEQAGPTDTGGELDHDANANCESVDTAPAENIHWPSRSAAAGAYYFSVVTYKECDTSDLNWHLVVRVQGRVVIDETGYGDSDYYELTYGENGRVQVNRNPAFHPVAHRGAK